MMRAPRATKSRCDGYGLVLKYDNHENTNGRLYIGQEGGRAFGRDRINLLALGFFEFLLLH